MGRAEALIACDRALLLAFSRHTSRLLRQRFTAGIALPWLEHFLELNVGKEIVKDKRAILAAHTLAGNDVKPDQAAVAELLAAARQVDRDFLHRITHLPIEIPIPYAAIEPIRAQRVERLLSLAGRLFAVWAPGMRLRQALAAAMARKEIEAQILKLLLLYADETRTICQSLRLPMLLRPLRDRLAENLFVVMTDTAGTLSAKATTMIYRRP